MYSAVSPPVKPVAPNTTTSSSRSAISGDLPGRCERFIQAGACSGGDPARHRRCDPLGGMRRLAREVEDRAPIIDRRRLGPEPLGVGCDPLLCVHRRAPTLSLLA